MNKQLFFDFGKLGVKFYSDNVRKNMTIALYI